MQNFTQQLTLKSKNQDQTDESTKTKIIELSSSESI